MSGHSCLAIILLIYLFGSDLEDVPIRLMGFNRFCQHIAIDYAKFTEGHSGALKSINQTKN